MKVKLLSRVRLCDTMDCSPPGSSVHGILQARVLEWIAMPSSRGSSRPRDGTQVSCTAGRFFSIWTTKEALRPFTPILFPLSLKVWHIHLVKMKVDQSCPTVCNSMDYKVHGILQNTVERSFSLLQGIFPTQGSNLGLLHCRWILYQLSHKGSPRIHL